MNRKIKAEILLVIIVFLTSVGESEFPLFPFIAFGCYGAYKLGKWEKNNNL